MATIIFDTHEFVKRLRDAGFTEPQAEVITDLQRETREAAIEQARHDYHLDELATKRDIELVRAELKKDIAESKAELTRWIIGAGLLQTSLIIGALMKMAHLI